MSFAALAFIALIFIGGTMLSRFPDHPNLDRDLPRGCFAIALIAGGLLGLAVTGLVALVRGL